jgi:hypothetical protein
MQRHMSRDSLMPVASAQSALRRLRFAADWRFRFDSMLVAVGLRRGHAEIIYAAGNLAYDVFEAARTGRLRHPGRAHMSALAEPVRLPQDARYRGYWYDASSHSLVGLHLGIDLHYHRGKYYVIESNLNAAVRAERRQLYDARIDPMIRNIASSAKSAGFEQVVLCRRCWTASVQQEFILTSEEIGIKVTGMTHATLDELDDRGNTPLNPIIALPEHLEPRTMYVIFSPMHWGEPLCHFVHEKALVSRWLSDAIASSGASVERLACAPSYNRPVLRMDADEDRWPNLVVKLASCDKGEFVVMGRFRSEDEARRSLKLDDHPGSVPGVFRRRLGQRVRDRLSRGSSQAVYQPFIPPEVVDGRARLIRLHVFVSPLVDAFLSAHGVLAGEELPDRVQSGLVTDPRPYIVNYSNGARYCLLESEKEEELRRVAQEFGLCARRAIGERFETGPPRSSGQSPLLPPRGLAPAAQVSSDS